MHAAAKQGSVHVEIHRGVKAYSRRILGQFLEHFHRQIYGGIFEPGSPLSDDHGFRTDVIAAVRDLRVPVVRWPGGCFVSAYHWVDGIGPQRSPAFDKAWLVEEPNTFGTDEFVRWCRAVGAEPYICTNAGSGGPEEMSDWVEYCNGAVGKWAHRRQANGFPDPHGVRFWSVGNENYGDWEMGAKSSEQWAGLVTESAKMMLRADPTLKLSAAAVADAGWTLPLLRHAGKYLSYVSIHKYWDPLWEKDEPSGYGVCMMASTDPDRVIDLAGSILSVAGLAGKVKVAFDEWNLRSWHHPPRDGVFAGDVGARDRNDDNSVYTMADAVFSACFLNACLRRCDTVDMACMAPLVNTRGPLYAYPGGIVKRTTYHALWMYANLLRENVVSAWVRSDPYAYAPAGDPSRASAVPALDAVATCDDQLRDWRLLLANRDASEGLACAIHLEGADLDGALEATVLTADSPDAYNDVGSPDRVIPVRTRLTASHGIVQIPPHSIVVVSVRR